MNHRVTLCHLAAALLAGSIGAAWAGDDEVPRRTFRESRTYPFVFRPEGYLASNGPVPMRIEQGPPPFSKRLAPPLPAAAKATEKPALPVLPPLDEPEPAKNTGKKSRKDDLALPEPDLGKVPDEVLGFFREKEANTSKRLYLFDPIFQPARPNELPKSKASYTQKP